MCFSANWVGKGLPAKMGSLNFHLPILNGTHWYTLMVVSMSSVDFIGLKRAFFFFCHKLTFE